MVLPDTLPQSLRTAVENGVLKRLPLTFLPFANQQLREWDYLFPNERRSTEQLLLYVNSLSPEQSANLFHDVIALEEKMNVKSWKFSTSEQTIENASLLARSPYFQPWRDAVQAVFDASAQYARISKVAPAPENRLILLEIPRPLNLEATRVWQSWGQMGWSVPLDIPADRAGSVIESLVVGSPTQPDGLLTRVVQLAGNQPAEAWILDAGHGLVDATLALPLSESGASRPVLLSYSRLDACRENFTREMNTIRKDLSDADSIYDRLRKVDMAPWCPAEVSSHPAAREFVRNLYLSGNGAVIFGNSFAQWGSSEALRRARPHFLVARFGVRSKPKPFTAVAVFENPDQVNPIPAVDDLPGSAIDAQILARYVWLAATRYDEYLNNTVCVCIAESISQAYLVAPKEFALKAGPTSLPLDSLGNALRDWVSS
jgi:hypothetical protein